jgi:hypothetical protein
MTTINLKHTGNFTTSMLNLKDRIGEDSIRDLNGLAVDYTFKNVFSLVKGFKTKIMKDYYSSFL